MERWIFTAKTLVVMNGRDGSITFSDGRAFPQKTSQGSSFIHQRT
jgi:hypothetical protein